MPALSGLRRLLEAPPRPPADTICQRCGSGMSAEHGHVADLETRGLLCVCDRCLAAVATGASPTHRVVPRRYLMLGPAELPEAAWASLEIPVGIAFFFHNSTLGRSVAAYPSPAGATESLLEPDTWQRLLEALPAHAAPAADVEALLIRRTLEASESFIVPIDACYELVGRIRRRWSGFGGGPEARAEIDAFFAALRERSGAG